MMIQVRDIHDQNLCSVVAVCLQSPHVSILEQYCSKGGLMDVLKDTSVDLDMMFKLSIASDISHGMTELHRQGIVHGRLTSSNCVIDNRWVSSFFIQKYIYISGYNMLAFPPQNTKKNEKYQT